MKCTRQYEGDKPKQQLAGDGHHSSSTLKALKLPRFANGWELPSANMAIETHLNADPNLATPK